MTPETVYIPSGRAGRAFEVYHTDPDCHLLAKAGDTRAVERDVLADDLRECRACRGLDPVDSGHGGGHLRSLKAAADGGGSA